MQPANDPESQPAFKLLIDTGKCLFGLSINKARFLPSTFCSWARTGREKDSHSFVGEAACERWTIGQNKSYLWGNLFWLICNCNSIKAVLEYNRPISVVNCWIQELLAYNYTVMHRSCKMIQDVDSLTRRFGRLVRNHLCISAIFHDLEPKRRSNVYYSHVFASHTSKKAHEISSARCASANSQFYVHKRVQLRPFIYEWTSSSIGLVIIIT